MSDALSTDERAYATEWADAEIRVIRQGDDYKLELHARDDVGCLMHHTVTLDEREAGDLRDIWLEITMTTDLRVDPNREEYQHGTTGIYVRARMGGGGWGNADIAELDRISLLRFLRSRGGANLWAENTVLAMLEHEPFQADEARKVLENVHAD